jgi:hypothetical protein
MKQRLTIGDTPVLIHNSELLSEELASLRRLSDFGENRASDNSEVSITVEARPDRDWDLDVTNTGNLHRFGRPTYAFEVEPLDHHVRIILAAPPKGNDLYWFQRDIFGVLACVSGGLMLHASAVFSDSGDAWVFCGESGAGKSTICRLLAAEGFKPISDEVNWLLADDENGLQIVNQPYWFGSADQPYLPVKGLYLLRQGERCTIEAPLPKSETFARLLAGHLSIDTQYDFMKERANALKHLVEEHPVNPLEFNLKIEELLPLL